MKRCIAFVAACLLLNIYSLRAQTCPSGLSGTYTIGPAGNFTSITAAIISLQANGLADNVILELQTGYTGAVETYPVTFPVIPCQNAFSITLRPAAGTAGFSLSTISANALILDGINNLFIDGRPGGTGSSKTLSIESTASNGNAIDIRNDASGNRLDYLVVKSVPTTAANGIIIFGTTSGTSGNDNNRVSFCDIGHPTSFSSNLIYAGGTAGKENSNNNISNNNLFNFFGSTIVSSGINISQNNTACIISGNSFYQAGPVSFTSNVSCFAIRINTTSGSGFTINDNFIGGTAPGCTGTALICSGPGTLGGIIISTAVTAPSGIDNNTISNMSVTMTAVSSAAQGIFIAAGKINCGTTTGNIIGSETVPNSITLSSSVLVTNPVVHFAGIGSSNNDTVVISNNRIGGVSGGGTGRLSVYGVLLSGNACRYVVSNNVIGSANLVNSITNNAASYSVIHGISSNASSTTKDQLFSNNYIAGLTNTGAGAGSQSAGIYASSGRHFITGNWIRNISSSSAATGTNSASVIGISSISGVAATGISGNTIFSLVNNIITGSPSIIGINACQSSTSAILTISNNFVHSLFAASSGNAILTGIYTACGNSAVFNNMIRLGIDSTGNPVTGNYEIRGIYQGTQTAAQKIAFNSVYIGGAYSGNQNNYAFYSLDASVAKQVTNNIFVNARSNNSGSGKNYATLVQGTGRKPPGLSMNGNLYYAPGLAGFMGYFNGLDYNDFSWWRDATGVDSMSGKGDPGYINPSGNTSTVNLHLGSASAAEAAGVADAAITADFDNQSRSGLTPTDIGADAGNVTVVDAIAPTHIYTPLGNTPSYQSRTVQVRIVDVGSGVPVSGSLQPRIWYRRTVPAISSWTSAAGTLASGTTNDGTWNFMINYSALGVFPSPQNIYQYYFTSQDNSGNLELNPATGGSHTDVNTQVTAPSNPNSYRILDTLAIEVNVGSGEMFTTLTGSNGLFHFMRDNIITADTKVNITSDLLEDGTYSLNADSTRGYRLTIRPSAAATRTISNASNLSQSMLRVIDISNIVFDGRFNGSGKYFRFINTNTVPGNCKPVFMIDSSSSNIIIRNSIVESNSGVLFGDYGAITIGSAGVNKSVEIRDNQVRDAVGSPGTAGLLSQSIKSDGLNNKFLTVTGNEIFNFRQYGISFIDVGDSCVIDSNHFYYNAAQFSAIMPRCINIENGVGHIISNNFIGGTAPHCGGTPWTTNNTYGQPFSGIYVYRFGGSRPSYITNNKVSNINMTNSGETAFTGIVGYGKVIITGNLVGDPAVPNSIVNAGTGFGAYTFGIQTGGLEADSAVYLNNTVCNMTASGNDDDVTLLGLYVAGNGKAVVKGNHVYSLTSSGYPFYYVSLPAVMGITIWNGMRGYEVEDNTVHDLKAISTVPDTRAIGIEITIGSNSYTNTISRNRIYNIENLSDSGWIFGIKASLGIFRLENNQIALTNGVNTNRVNIFGIEDKGDSAYRYYNSVYIGGSTTAGNINSYAYRFFDGRLIKLQNNVFYNERTGGGGTHYAIGVSFNPHPNPKWSSTTSNYNFFIANDSAKIGAWGFFNTPQSMISWRTASQGDSSSFAALSMNVPSASFFKSIATGNLNINNLDPLCWYVNGKALPVAQISADYDSLNIRSTVVSNGATDIGSDEFNTSTSPGPLVILGRHLPGEIDSLVLNGRIIATITWGNTGTLPAFGNARYYSGEWPRDLTNGQTVSNARTMNGWLDLPVTGGSGYSYSLRFFYDSSMLGRIQDVSQMVLHKKNTGENGSWQMLFPTAIDPSARTATANGLTSFSEFTGAESSAPLVLPGSHICPNGTTSYRTNITGAAYTYQWQVDPGTGFVNLANNAIYSGVIDSILVITNPPALYNRYQYRCVTNTGSGTINSTVFLLKITSSWKGTAGTDWTNPSNWSCGQVPDANTDVLVGSGLPNYPVITTNVICRSITASPGTVIQVNGGSIELTGK